MAHFTNRVVNRLYIQGALCCGFRWSPRESMGVMTGLGGKGSS